MKLRVLFAEDDPFIRRVVQIALTRDGFEVEIVENGALALARLEACAFDAVVLDGMMPEVDGLEACRRIRAHATLASLPVVILSARSQNTDEAAALAVGATAYIKKPFDATTLGAELRAILLGAAHPC